MAVSELQNNTVNGSMSNSQTPRYKLTPKVQTTKYLSDRQFELLEFLWWREFIKTIRKSATCIYLSTDTDVFDKDKMSKR